MREQRRVRLFGYLILIPATALWAVPLVWMFLTAFKSKPEVFSTVPHWLPQTWTLSNFSEAWSRAPFGQYYINTILVVAAIALIQLVTTTLAAYAFAKLKFPGSNLLFMLFLVQMTITPAVTLLPNYLTVKTLGLLNTRTAILLPYLASAYGTFLMRQSFLTIPKELDDSARMDGCTGLRYLWHVAVPLAKPAMITFVLASITSHWNELLWPMIVTDSSSVRTLTIGLSALAQQAEGGAEWTLLMAATLIVIAPLLLLFVLFQRRFIQTFVHSGIKG